MVRVVRQVRAVRQVAIVAIAIGTIVGCSGDDDGPDTTMPALANPASVYCEERGGQVEIVDEAGGQVGYCLLPDGRRVDEWELYRSETSATSEP